MGGKGKRKYRGDRHGGGSSHTSARWHWSDGKWRPADAPPSRHGKPQAVDARRPVTPSPAKGKAEDPAAEKAAEDEGEEAAAAAAPAAAKKAGTPAKKNGKAAAPAAAAPAAATPAAASPLPLPLLGALAALLLALAGGAYVALVPGKPDLAILTSKAFEGTDLKSSSGYSGVSLVAFM